MFRWGGGCSGGGRRFSGGGGGGGGFSGGRAAMGQTLGGLKGSKGANVEGGRAQRNHFAI